LQIISPFHAEWTYPQKLRTTAPQGIASMTKTAQIVSEAAADQIEAQRPCKKNSAANLHYFWCKFSTIFRINK